MKNFSFRTKNEHFYWLLTLAIVFVIVFTLFYSIDTFFVAKSDFVNIYVGAEMVAKGMGKFLYVPLKNYEVQTEILSKYGFELLNENVFRPLPFVAVLLLPLTLFDLLTAFRVFILINAFLLFLMGYLALKIFNKSVRKTWLFFLVPFLFLPHLFSLEMGQTSILLAFIVFLIYKNFLARKYLIAGLLTPLLLIKTQYGIFSPFLFLMSGEKTQFLKGFLVSFTLLLLVSVSVSGVDALLDYPSYLLTTENPNFGSRMKQMFTIYSMFARTQFPGKYAVFANLSLFLVSFFVFAKRQKVINSNNAFISLTLMSLVFSMHVLGFDLSFLILPIFILLARVFNKGKLRFNMDFLAAILLFLVPGMVLVGDAHLSPLILWAVGYYYLHV